MNAAQRFTVIVVNYNGGTLLSACAQSLIAAGLPARQLIVIDNGSKNDSADGSFTRMAACRTPSPPLPTLLAEVVPKELLRYLAPTRYTGRPRGEVPLRETSV